MNKIGFQTYRQQMAFSARPEKVKRVFQTQPLEKSIIWLEKTVNKELITKNFHELTKTLETASEILFLKNSKKMKVKSKIGAKKIQIHII